MIEVIQPTINDLPLILNLWQKQYDFHHKLDNFYYVPFNNLTKIKFKKYLTKAIKLNNPCLLIAKIDKEIIGFITFSISKSSYFDSNIEKYGEIIELYVDQKYRRKGIGNLLMSETEKFFKKQNIKILKLQVSSFNQNTIEFYNHLGYTNRQTLMFKELRK